MNYTLENTTLFEGLNVTGVKAGSGDRDTGRVSYAIVALSLHAQ